MIEYTGYVILTVGALFIFLSALSIARFHDIYSRVNSFVKLSFFGILCMTLGALAICGFSEVGVKTLLLFALVLATLPFEGRLIIKAARKNSIKMAHEISSTDGASKIK
jgi:monovalent cation/proton antiporter MnhG/PhaG subunit